MQFWAVVVKEHILRGACSPYFELNGNAVIFQRTDYGLCLKSQYETALCLSSCRWDYPHSTFISVCCGEAPFHSPVVLSYERWRLPFAMGFQKSLQYQSLGIQRSFLQCLEMPDVACVSQNCCLVFSQQNGLPRAWCLPLKYLETPQRSMFYQVSVFPCKPRQALVSLCLSQAYTLTFSPLVKFTKNNILNCI